jgi:hypothetical protein
MFWGIGILCSGTMLAQETQKPASTVTKPEPVVIKPKSEEFKHEQLSKKLLQRKNELRNMEQPVREQHHFDVREKHGSRK